MRKKSESEDILKDGLNLVREREVEKVNETELDVVTVESPQRENGVEKLFHSMQENSKLADLDWKHWGKEDLVLGNFEKDVETEVGLRDTRGMGSFDQYSMGATTSILSMLTDLEDEAGSHLMRPRLMKQDGRADQIFKTAEPTKEEITKFIEKNHLFDEQTGLRYRLYKSTFGAIFKAKEYPSDFSELGPGINSYFHFLTFFGYMFAFFAVLSFPAVFFNITCGTTLRGADGSSTIAATTLGNLFQPEDAINVSSVYDCKLGEHTFQISRIKVQEYNIIYDILLASLFLGMTHVLSSVFLKEMKKNGVTITQVTNLPQDTSFEDLTEHFNEVLRYIESKSRNDKHAQTQFEENQLGQVFDVQLVTATKLELVLAIEHAQLSKKVEQLESKVAVAHRLISQRKLKKKSLDSLRSKHDKAKRKLHAFWSSERARKIELFDDLDVDSRAVVVKAYVTFDTILAKHEIYSIYNARLKCSWCREEKNPVLFFSDKRPRVHRAAPPSVLKWENMEESKNSRRTRSCISGLMVFSVLLLTASFLYIVGRAEDSNLFGFLDGVQSDVFEEAECSLFNFTDELKLELCNASKIDIKEDTNSSCVEYIYCDCTERLAEGDSSIISDDECQVFFLDSIYNNAFSFASAVLVTLFNVVLEGVLVGSVSFERDEDKTKQERKLLIRFFFAMYLNTAVVTYLQSFNLESVFGFTLPIIGSGDFSDFVNEWYGEVGSDLILIGFGQILGPHIGSVGFYLYNLLRRRLKTPISQKGVEDLYLGPEFILSFRYAQIVLTIAFCLTYSAGIPLLYLITAFCCFGTFWVDKYLMVFHCRKPINYSNELVIWICGLLNTPEIFPIGLGGISFSYVSESPIFDELQNATEGETEKIFARLTSGPMLLLTLFFLLFLMLLILYQFEKFFIFVNKIRARVYIFFRQKVNKYIFKSSEEQLLLELEQLEQFRKERMGAKLDLHKLNGVPSYHILANPEYRNSLHLKKETFRSSQMLFGKPNALHSTLDVLPLLLKGKTENVQRFVFNNVE
eukprot:snap_masked-scaffold_13-processed-gene-2.23-mRNA-1 protein AED:1.00 eAED:1.00 QI:0/0/0/0/1/1/3/0/1026